MNVKDVISPPAPDTRWAIAQEIFDRQQQLEDSYWQIEKRYAPLVSPQVREGQILIKDFLWRAMEEVGEALEKQELIRQGGPYEKDSFDEEMADAFHFVTGLCVILGERGIFQEALEQYHYRSTVGIEDFVMAAGILGNTLKMKPWKQTDVLTDIGEFYRLLKNYVMSFLELWGLEPAQVYDLYWRKSEVNLFRIRSNY